MGKTYENALNFLLYSYFGIEDTNNLSDSNSKTSQKLCAYRAYLDLARTVDYKYSTKNLEDMKRKSTLQEDKDEANNFISNKNERIKTVCKVIVDCVNNDSQGIQSSDEFNNWHSTLCETIKNLMNCPNARILKEEKDFTYGQAQKWINMTLKYFWLLDLLPTCIKPEYLHVPVDSYIIEAAKSNDIESSLQISKCPITKDAWSSWNSEIEYSSFQQKLKECSKNKGFENAIEWENKAWIEVAKKRAAK